MLPSKAAPVWATVNVGPDIDDARTSDMIQLGH